ncbi:hypothetical protein LOCC1_G008737 [Lachnellula occidentalis]|uniref:Uncharacterized protein n=1 Tax=Lachnellula occidentalis TaxID=215460 RepID=A0A8H8RFU9_9HELO|nr:hypothetical protein LOCC1_G008737 [Lachnellula occidentalis]
MDRNERSYPSSSQHHSNRRGNGPVRPPGVDDGHDRQSLPSSPRSPTTLSRMPLLDRPSTTIASNPRSPTTLSRRRNVDDPSATSTTSTTIPAVPSTFTTAHDQEMASNQTRIHTLQPAQREEQDEWAREQLRQHSTCAVGYGWKSVSCGYQCEGQHHIVTHELLAEGRGGIYQGMWDWDADPMVYWWYGPLYGEEIRAAAYGSVLPERVMATRLTQFPSRGD